MCGGLAAGEVARTGMHGANRLASNSLLEGLVVGARAGREAAGHARSAGAPMAKVQPAQRVALKRSDLHKAMTRWASVVRDADGLRHLIDELACAVPRTMVTRADVEDVALTMSARAVAAAALARTETRGCHHRGDFPDTDPAQAVPVRAHGTEDGRVGVVEPAVPVAR
jgi:L-aspartate oxidase